ncbi:S-adenosyl-L-methionine-dependent methyltransferase [Patellaria atrata CBS 101060]|uniref:S-adenosyl-L-methionine-dependent methyltransferase n=1 Tax=Patellaria atrata CBS 101060 TaxID=1346257 RepID=A0A9P4S248_9PEZI|nr:S-adenosyl-L-methionine-dependent methyltransferase [Patellaria atrata CBS 101060]
MQDPTALGDVSDVTPDDSSVSGDSALGEEIAESTASLRSSLYDGVTENGRRYHKYKEGKYVLPSDEAESDRLDLQHQMFLMTTEYKLFLAPIGPNIHNALDVGTGTGIWAIDFAQERPECRVIGVDLSPIQPVFVPENLQFEIDDVEEPWTWSQKFDYIHARMMTASFKNWENFFKQCFDNLTPGGWIEMQDTHMPLHCTDGTLNESTALWKWSDMIVNATGSIGHPLVAHQYKKMMEDVGFIDVTEIRFVWPQNSWPADPRLKELGRWNLVNTLDGLQGYSMALMTRVLGMSSEEVELFLVDVRKDMKNRRIHAHWPIYFVYGRKPEK